MQPDQQIKQDRRAVMDKYNSCWSAALWVQTNVLFKKYKHIKKKRRTNKWKIVFMKVTRRVQKKPAMAQTVADFKNLPREKQVADTTLDANLVLNAV